MDIGQRRREKIAALEVQAKGHVDRRSSSSNETSPQASSASDGADSVEDVFTLSSEDGVPGFSIHGNPFSTNVLEDLNGTHRSCPIHDLTDSPSQTSPSCQRRCRRLRSLAASNIKLYYLVKHFPSQPTAGYSTSPS
jgi:hypothetical protein